MHSCCVSGQTYYIFRKTVFIKEENIPDQDKPTVIINKYEEGLTETGHEVDIKKALQDPDEYIELRFIDTNDQT